MGGHGGLNILPQKKWNVYNYDNRAIVEKDIKQHKQKQRIKFQKDRINQLRNKMQVLIDDNKCQGELKKPNSLLIQELNKIKEQNQHINLFAEEERIIQNRQIEQIKRIKEIQAIRDKSLDYSSKFLGTYTQEKEIPWYVKNKNKHHDTNTKQKFKYYEDINKDEQNQKYQQNYNTIRNNKNINNNSFQQRQRSRQQNKNNNQEKQKYILKIENKQKNINVMQKLKLQRLKRQAKQHKKTEELKKYSYYKK